MSAQYKSYSTGKIMISHTNLINGHTETLFTTFTINGKPWYSLNKTVLNNTTNKKLYQPIQFRFELAKSSLY